MTESATAILALADGTLFDGIGIGHIGCSVGEIVFNTAMSGYQEILTDPSYAQQLITLTYPHIGNVGTNVADQESSKVWASGLIIRDLSITASSWRSEQPLEHFMREHKMVGISDIDTRQLTRLIREKGAQGGCIMSADVDTDKAIALAQGFAGLQGQDVAQEVSTSTTYIWQETTWLHQEQQVAEPVNGHVVVYDFGVKRNILRLLVDRGCRLTVVPAKTAAQDVLALEPDGIFLSNGPGDPAPCDYALKAIKFFLEQEIPLFGICLGHQLLALACGAQTEKMKFGHHGANHPVEDLATKKVLITSQNHGFTVSEQGLPSHLSITHRSLFDGSIQGIACTDKPAFGFQGHPEASPGPHDVGAFFDHFVSMMRSQAKRRKPSMLEAL